ncbi:MAG: hypothetical protein V2I25_16740 [Woeseiaceae bacterium]|jgi:hypothetical protein|nr:hypothetical protein [Woeseiaceae bacterium]
MVQDQDWLAVASDGLTGQDNELLAGWLQRRLTLHEAYGCVQYPTRDEFMGVRRYSPVEGAEEMAAFRFLDFASEHKRHTQKEENMLLAAS